MLPEESDDMAFDFEMHLEESPEEPDYMPFDVLPPEGPDYLEMLPEESDDMAFDFEMHLEESPEEPDYMPFDVLPPEGQDYLEMLPVDILTEEIMKRLPIESLLKFRSLSNKWKSFIDNPEFIKNYHITKPKHHLLVQYKLHAVQTYTSIIDNNSFPQPMSSLTAPESLSLLKNKKILNSVDGLFCFYGKVDSEKLMACFRCGEHESAMMALLWNPSVRMALLWNPSVRKSVGIVVPIPSGMDTVVGFGVSYDTCDPKLVKISMRTGMWKVEVFTLSTRVWRTVIEGEPFKLDKLKSAKVFANGLVYFRAFNDGANLIISFDLNNEIFGEVRLPDTLVHTPYLKLHVAKVKESLGLLKDYDDGDTAVWEVWTREDDGADKPFTKIYTIRVERKFFSVIGFTNNGGAVMELDDDDNQEYRIEVYDEPSSRMYNTGITRNNQGTFSTWSYMKTIQLLDQEDSIIL